MYLPKRPRGGVRAGNAGLSRRAPLFPLLCPALPHAPRSHTPRAPTHPPRLLCHAAKASVPVCSLFLYSSLPVAPVHLPSAPALVPPPPPHVPAIPALQRRQGTAFGLPRGHARLCVPRYPHALTLWL